MIVNPEVDVHTKTLNHRKILRKSNKNNILLNIKRTLSLNINSMGAWFSHSACQGQVHSQKFR